MRNLVHKELITRALLDISITDELRLITTKLDNALEEIIELKNIQTMAILPDIKPWVFDIQRDSEGRMTGVIANKGDKQEFLI